jgi:hypothetical protein
MSIDKTFCKFNRATIAWLEARRLQKALPDLSAKQKPTSRRETIRDRLMSQVRHTASGCMLWTGSHSGTGRGGGYGRISLDGATMAVHRVMWTNEHGIIPHKKQIDHKCKNRLCINIDHLELVTHKQNQKRRASSSKIKGFELDGVWYDDQDFDIVGVDVEDVEVGLLRQNGRTDIP